MGDHHGGAPRRASPLERTAADTIVEKRRGGIQWIYKTLAGTNGQYVLTSVVDGFGNATDLIYTQGYVSEIHNSAGQWIRFARKLYDSTLPSSPAPSTRIERVTDSSGRAMSFGYTSAGLLTTATDALGHVWSYSYGTNGRLTSATDPLENEFLLAGYDSQGRVASWTGETGTWTFDYTSLSGVTRATDALGNIWKYVRLTTGVRVEEPTGGAMRGDARR